ncbi:hypothetical protein ACF0H5_005701 [Mactra antiquata]
MTTVGVALLMMGVLAFCGFRYSVAEKERKDECSLSVWPRSISYFDSELKRFAPNFVHFQVEFNISTPFNTTSNVFRPLHWVWTYKSKFATFPYISWNIDYGLLSFGLLDSHTLDLDYVKINVIGDCNLTLGEYDTSKMIAKAFTDLVRNFSDGNFQVYDSNDFCYLSFNENITKTWSYLAAIYFNYPGTYFGYMCCHVKYIYTLNKYDQSCDATLQPKWEQSIYMPYWLGLFLFMYCPIILFQVSAWLVKDDPNTIHVEVDRFSVNDEDYQDVDNPNGKWIFLNGDSPIGITSFMQVILCNLSKRHPIVMSRIRRALCILLTPCIIYIQLAMYKNGIGITNSKISVRDLVKRGVPMGFLSILGDKEDRNKVFAPAFGGALCVLIMFYLQSFIFLVVPRSLNCIVERVMLYYIVRQMKDFGDGYLGLLSTAVERSQELNMHINNTAIFNGELILSNVCLNTVKAIRINGIRLDIAENTLHRLKREREAEKIRKVDNVYGIPRSLFDHLVKEHRPVHIQVLKLVFHLAAVILLVAATLGITSKVATGTNNEISEVMHVIFIVTVGALPRILEVALMNSRETVVRDIEEREIESSILEYWNKESASSSMNHIDQLQ